MFSDKCSNFKWRQVVSMLVHKNERCQIRVLDSPLLTRSNMAYMSGSQQSPPPADDGLLGACWGGGQFHSFIIQFVARTRRHPRLSGIIPSPCLTSPAQPSTAQPSPAQPSIDQLICDLDMEPELQLKQYFHTGDP